MNKFWINCQKGIGIGVTANNLADAIRIVSMEKGVFWMEPKFTDITCNLEFNDLDPNHVIPNMGAMSTRGVWFPNLIGKTYPLTSDIYLSLELTTVTLNKVGLDRALKKYLACGLKHAVSITDNLLEFEKVDIRIFDCQNLFEFIQECHKVNATLKLI